MKRRQVQPSLITFFNCNRWQSCKRHYRRLDDFPTKSWINRARIYCLCKVFSWCTSQLLACWWKRKRSNLLSLGWMNAQKFSLRRGKFSVVNVARLIKASGASLPLVCRHASIILIAKWKGFSVTICGKVANLLSERSSRKLCQSNGFGDTETASSEK